MAAHDEVSTLCLWNNSSISLKSLRISIVLASDSLDRCETLLGRSAQPVLQVLTDFRMVVDTMDLCDSANHNLHYVGHSIARE